MKSFIRPVAKDDVLRQFRYYLVTADAPEAALRFLELFGGATVTCVPVNRTGDFALFAFLPKICLKNGSLFWAIRFRPIA